MKKLVFAAAAGSLALMGAPALADDHAEMKAEVVEKDAKGKATKVKIGDKVYDVCTADSQDNCINPRDAGLKWGNRELNYWPGKPASQIDEPLPYDKPE